MAALRIIIEHSLEWNSSSFLKFVDFEKTFDSLDREVLWNLMAHYGIPQKFINIILERSILLSTFATTDNSVIPL
jgi:replication initiation and membrane attachment protein DnaB